MMKQRDYRTALRASMEAAREAGAIMRKNLHLTKKINEAHQHDIKLELDVRCQKLIERRLQRDFPFAILGEEGISGQTEASERWVIDPIDGTVNFTYGIPHACVSIALQMRVATSRENDHPDAPYQTVLGVVYDPFTDDMFTAIRGSDARLNGKPIAVSKRDRLDEAIVSIGFAKSAASLEKMLPQFNQLVHKVRKIRIMGAAALAMVYVASGRFDAYVESGVRLWDIAAGGLILESAGGDFFNEPVPGDHAYRIMANNGLLRKKLAAVARSVAQCL
jgi:myo-inositol-1(or 4)-monophosphatase